MLEVEDLEQFNKYISNVEEEPALKLLSKLALTDFYFFVKDVINVKYIDSSKSIIKDNKLYKEVCFAMQNIETNTMILLPRKFGKTLLTTLFILFYTLNYPNNTILLISETKEKAINILDAVKRFLLTHKVMNKLYPNKIPTGKYSTSKLSKTIKILTEASLISNQKTTLTITDRTTTKKEPNVIAMGIRQPVQSYRADLVIFEDILSEDYARYPRIKRMVDNNFMAVIPILEKNSKQLYVGTRYHYEDIPAIIRNRYHEGLSNWHFIETSVYDNNGNVKHPDIMDKEEIEKIRSNPLMSRAFFWAQYLNKPISSAYSSFNVESYQKYENLDLNKMKEIVIAIDLAFTSTGTSDKKAIVVVGKHTDSKLYLIDALSTTISIDKFYNDIEKTYLKYRRWCKRILIEINNAEYIFESYQKRNTTLMPLEGMKHTRADPPKVQRIINTLEPLLEKGHLLIPSNFITNNNIGLSELLNIEIPFFDSTSNTNKDDLLDAFQMGIEYLQNVYEESIREDIYIEKNNDMKFVQKKKYVYF